MIRMSNLVKEFRVYRNKLSRLKGIMGLAQANKDYTLVRAINGINLEVAQGQVHGLIGMNGAGKSTLLKLLTGVIYPTGGSIEMTGKVAALLELGTGFHHELTGRENVFLSGSIQGFSQEQMQEKIGEIEAFAELGDFFDRPVRIYSSGMYVRLAFALAVAIEPDVLIVDEALSVGDAYFQQKCLDRINQFKKKGVTILFVSHDIGAVKLLCDSVSLMNKGEVIFTGTPVSALELYTALLAEQKNASKDYAERLLGDGASDNGIVSGTKEATIESVQLLNSSGVAAKSVQAGQSVVVQVNAIVRADELEFPTCGIMLRDRLGYDVFGINSHAFGIKTELVAQGTIITYEFKCDLNVGPGDYTLTVALHSSRTHLEKNYDWRNRVLLIHVLPNPAFEFVGVARLVPSLEILVADGNNNAGQQ